MRILIAAGLLLAVVSATAETTYYRIELVPSGSLVSIGAPAVRGTTVVIHAYPNGQLMSIRRSDVRSVSPITAQEASKPAQKSLVAIGDLAMQGGGATTSSDSAPGSALARPAAAGAPWQLPRVIPTSDGMAVTTSAPK